MKKLVAPRCDRTVNGAIGSRRFKISGSHQCVVLHGHERGRSREGRLAHRCRVGASRLGVVVRKLSEDLGALGRGPASPTTIGLQSLRDDWNDAPCRNVGRPYSVLKRRAWGSTWRCDVNRELVGSRCGAVRITLMSWKCLRVSWIGNDPMQQRIHRG